MFDTLTKFLIVVIFIISFAVAIARWSYAWQHPICLFSNDTVNCVQLHQLKE